jgi:hypothetical protein
LYQQSGGATDHPTSHPAEQHCCTSHPAEQRTSYQQAASGTTITVFVTHDSNLAILKRNYLN